MFDLDKIPLIHIVDVLGTRMKEMNQLLGSGVGDVVSEAVLQGLN
jgi:hypothetical protein